MTSNPPSYNLMHTARLEEYHIECAHVLAHYETTLVPGTLKTIQSDNSGVEAAWSMVRQKLGC
jgi:hypothetical protein